MARYFTTMISTKQEIILGPQFHNLALKALVCNILPAEGGISMEILT